MFFVFFFKQQKNHGLRRGIYFLKLNGENSVCIIKTRDSEKKSSVNSATNDENFQLVKQKSSEDEILKIVSDKTFSNCQEETRTEDATLVNPSSSVSGWSGGMGVPLALGLTFRTSASL